MKASSKRYLSTGNVRRSETCLPQAAHAVIMYFLEVFAGRRPLKPDTRWADKDGLTSVRIALNRLKVIRPGMQCGARILRAAQPLPHCIEVVASLEWGNRLRSCMMELRDNKAVGWQLTHSDVL